MQWRACLRRMARARLLRVLPSDTGTQRLASGAFAVAKDHRDRFIGDRRRQNEKERLNHRACLPYAPMLKRILLKNGYSLRLNLRDVRDCPYLFQVGDERLKRQIIGPRVPEDWFSDLVNGSEDFLPNSAFKPWLSSDLTDPPSKPSREPGYVQVAIAGFMMERQKRGGGPTDGSFCLVEPSLRKVSCFRRHLSRASQCSGMSTLTTLRCWQLSRRPTGPPPRTICASNEPTPCTRLLVADQETCWGHRLRWTPLGRSPCWLAWKAWVSDVSTYHPRSHHLPRSLSGCQQSAAKEAPRGLGVSPLSFRRECLSFIDVSFVAAESFLSRKLCKLSRALLDELVLVSVLAPLYSANLRSPPLNELFAFDASDSRAGGCRAPVSDEQWRSLYDLSEE